MGELNNFQSLSPSYISPDFINVREGFGLVDARGRLLNKRDCDADALVHETKHEEEKHSCSRENDSCAQTKDNLMHYVSMNKNISM